MGVVSLECTRGILTSEGLGSNCKILHQQKFSCYQYYHHAGMHITKYATLPSAHAAMHAHTVK